MPPPPLPWLLARSETAQDTVTALSLSEEVCVRETEVDRALLKMYQVGVCVVAHGPPSSSHASDPPTPHSHMQAALKSDRHARALETAACLNLHKSLEGEWG